MDDILPDLPRKGRGAVSNKTGRFETYDHVRVDDGWPGDDEDPSPLRTTLGVDTARHVITYNTSPDVPFDRSINPYRGCEHGCVYCFARPTHAYYGLSPGLDFESRLFYKPDVADILRRELHDPRYKPAKIALGTNTDPYQPIDREKQLMRQILLVLREFNHPVTIVTKSALILRDLDILADMASQNLASVALSITTLNRHVARVMEPRAATPAKRLAALKGLSEAGVPTSVLAAPMIPAINDMELERILEAAAEAGAQGAGYILLRLPLEIRHLFEEWLHAHFPDRAKHVLSLIRDTRNGRSYQSEWGVRMRGTGSYAEMMRKRHRLAIKRLGLGGRDRPLDISKFQPPPRSGDQLSLL